MRETPEFRKTVRARAKERILSEGASYDFDKIHKEFAKVKLAAIDHAVANGYLYFGWGDNERTPTITFEDEDGYSILSKPILKMIQEELDAPGYRNNSEYDRNYRFLRHMQRSIKQFVFNEKRYGRA